MANLVFFDGECALCNSAVRFIHQRSNKFQFAPLAGTTAAQHLPSPIDPSTMYLLENYGDAQPRLYTRSKAAFRICWHLGGWWRLPGLLSFLPSFLADWAYRLLARNRHLFRGGGGDLPPPPTLP